MNRRQQQSYSGLFNLFAYDKPDKRGRFLERLGKFSLTIGFFAGCLLLLFPKQNTLPNDILLGIWLCTWFFGLIMFIATGIHYSGQAKGKTSFLASTFDMLKGTFLYIFLPALIIAVALMVWAIATNQRGL